MTTPALGLQGAIVARLKADTAVAAIVAGRVYDRVPAPPGGVPPDASFPYVNLGADQVLPERADGYDGSDVRLTLHAWSRAVGFPEVKRLDAAIRSSLHEAPLALAGDRLVDLAFAGSVFLRDPDGLTSHAVISFRALTEPAD